MPLIESMIATCSSYLYRVVLVSCGGLLVSLFGSDYHLYQAVAVITFLDFATGLMVGVKTKTVSSRKGFSTIKKWTYFVLLIIASVHLARLLPEINFVPRWIAGAIAINEFLSITENGASLGLPMPKQIKDLLSNIAKNVPERK
jgi:toxin secretion/phage lysis holin